MKIFLTLVLFLIALLSLFSGVDESAVVIYNETFDRAVYSFALAKGLNAIISVLQSSELNIGFFVAGGSIGIGQILDPINDLVERFSMVMLISSVSLGVQHLLLLLAKSMFLKVVLSLSALVVMIALWIGRIQRSMLVSFFIKLVLLLIILRFGAVVFIHTNHILYNEVYAEEYKSSSDYISGYKSNLEVLQEDKKKIASSLSSLESKSEIFSKKVIQIITMFVISTVLFPLVFIWFFLFLLRMIFSMKIDYDIILQSKKQGD